ncbi:MAG: hypothetical protein ACF8NJ_01755 [Phycisphaerales bacterium JB038]
MNEPGHISETRLTLLICLLLSLLGHVLFLPGVSFHGRRSHADAAEANTAEPFEASILRSLVPGIQEHTPAKITWIGYDEEIEHLATPEELDQALMERGGDTRAAAGAGAGASSPSRAELQARAAALAARFAQSAEASQRRADLLGQLLERAGEAVLTRMEQTVEREEELAAAPPEADAVAETAAESTETAAAESEVAAAESEAAGAPSDRDADATSDEPEIIEVRLGRPIAREGVEIRTTKPQLSVVRRWSSLHARAPLMRLNFRHDGTVGRVTVLEGTGYKHVDQDFIDSLYEWTAMGPQIEALGESETLPFVVRLQPI